mmetsp:Transcript_58041/g.142368  ORF Transcript_58041/g.142368 Transcript_58041/m.142368 type:complete len:360 (+) Transcript_58041:817-1896(+)
MVCGSRCWRRRASANLKDPRFCRILLHVLLQGRHAELVVQPPGNLKSLNLHEWKPALLHRRFRDLVGHLGKQQRPLVPWGNLQEANVPLWVIHNLPHDREDLARGQKVAVPGLSASYTCLHRQLDFFARRKPPPRDHVLNEHQRRRAVVLIHTSPHHPGVPRRIGAKPRVEGKMCELDSAPQIPAIDSACDGCLEPFDIRRNPRFHHLGVHVPDTLCDLVLMGDCARFRALVRFRRPLHHPLQQLREGVHVWARPSSVQRVQELPALCRVATLVLEKSSNLLPRICWPSGSGESPAPSRTGRPEELTPPRAGDRVCSLRPVRASGRRRSAQGGSNVQPLRSRAHEGLPGSARQGLLHRG